MRRKRKSVIMILISLLFFLTFATSVSGTEKCEKIRVGFYEFPYLQNVEKEGKYSGYSYDYLQAIAQYAGWEYEYITTATYSECLEMLKNGEIDIMGFLQKTPERQEFYDYPDLSSATCMSLLVTDQDNKALVYEDFSSFDGITVGIQKGSARNAGFLEYCKKNDFMVHTIAYDTKEALFDAIHAEKIDAILISSNQSSPNYRIIAKFDTSPVYYVTTKGNSQVLQELDFALEKIKTTTPDFDDSLYKKYYDFTDGQPAVLSKEETAYLKEHAFIQVLYDATREPFEQVQKNGMPSGIAIDVLEAVSNAVGVKFRYTNVDNQKEKTEMFNSGAYDVIPGIIYNYQWANDHNVLITQPYLNVDYMVVYRDDRTENSHVALPRGFYISDVIEKIMDTNAFTTYYDTVEECVEAVQKGHADYTYANSYEAEYYMGLPQYRLLKFRTVQGLSQQVSVGISKDADPLLFSILTKGLSSISQEEIREIIRAHINHPKESNFLDMMYTNPVQFTVILVAMTSVLCAYFMLFSLYRMKKRQNEILQIANKAKSNFLSHVSHDMRTPMNAIIGISSLGMETTDLEKSKEYHEKVNQTSKYLLRLINDTLDMSSMENNKVKLHLEPYYYHEFIYGIETVIHERASEKGVIFQAQIESGFDKPAMFDKLRLQQIFINLINNAIKFTPKGGIVTLLIDTSVISPEKIKAKFTIRDTGVGMSKAFQERMFEPFEQEDDSYNPNIEGTGLGLSIVKQLVDLMGGTIQCKSQLGKGTEFLVELEADVFEGQMKAKREREKIAWEEILNGRKILLCEDHPLNTQIAKALLEKKGCIVEHGENGQAGVILFANSGVGYYDAILMDIRMPILNGFEATALIRSLERADAHSVPIIAMTANSFEEDREESLEAGINTHLCKPIDAQELFETLAKAIKNRIN